MHAMLQHVHARRMHACARRLIDIVMSNCINSGLNKLHVITAFNTFSLNRYLTKTYNLVEGG